MAADKRRVYQLASIVRVDRHIVMGEIRGPDRRTVLATPQVNSDSNLFLRHDRAARSFSIAAGTSAIFHKPHVAQVNHYPVDVEILHRCSTYSGQNAAPVGIRGV